MGEKHISWTAGEIIYKAGYEPYFACLLNKGEVEIISDKGTRVALILKMRYLATNQSSKYIRTFSAVTLKEFKALLIQKTC